GSLLIFTSNKFTATDLATMPFEQAEQIRIAEAQTVQTPYLWLAGVVLFVAFLFWITKMPEPVQPSTSGKRGWEGIFKNRHLVLGIVAQFCYVGAQACLWGYFIDLKIEQAPEQHFAPVEFMKPFFEWLTGDGEALTAKRWAAFHLSFGFILFMVGRFAGTWMMSFIRPQRLLTVFAAATFLLFVFGVNASGLTGVVAILFANFFMSIMFPTIFALGTKNLGEQVKIGSSLIIMAIVGGALLPPALGAIADSVSYQKAFWLPALCFLMIMFYGWKGHKIKEI
ncbi:MAG: hypothetical protein AAB316_05065, partial [Bacteroidota bacterium]